MKRLCGVALCVLLLAGCGGGTTGWTGDLGSPPLTVMTQNLYYGADLRPAITGIVLGDPDMIVGSVTQIWATVQLNDFPTRAIAVVNAIEVARPDVIGLQEVSVFRSQYPSDAFTGNPTPATHVELDMLEVLLDELARRGLEYEAVVAIDSFDFEFPRLRADFELEDLRQTDREVILVRTDLPAWRLKVLDAFGSTFETNAGIPGMGEIPAAWAGVDLRVCGQTLRVLSAHPEADYPEIRYAQTLELIEGPAAVEFPVVLMGDMNTDAAAIPPWAAYELLVASGFEDAWLLAGPPEIGYTWGRSELLNDPADTLYQRLDLVLVGDHLGVDRVECVGEDLEDCVGGLWPSDHAGLVAQVRILR